jgi:hypothetical protein
MKKILLIIFIVVLAWNLNAQTYNMNNTPVTTCSGTFYDSGGSGGNYSINEDFEKTFTPSIAGNMLEFVFTSFETESATFDWLEIYDGPTTASPLIGKYGGTASPGTITATNPTGELTFVWHSDGSVTELGWSANISCITITSYLMTNGSETTCSGVFMDPEGTGGYNDFNGSMTMTFNSGSTDQLQFDFTVFQTRETADNLKIYDGPNTGSPLIGTYANTTSPGTILSSGNSLTFVWSTDNNGTDPGWEANISCVSDMSVTSITTVNASTANVAPNDVNQEVICVEITTTGTLNPLTVSNFLFRTGGTNPPNDVENARLWYTGNSAVFATTTQYGATIANPPPLLTNMNIPGSQTLLPGTNYFWLSYDIRAGAAGGNNVNSGCYRATIDGVNHNCTTVFPSGGRTIIVPPANDDPCDAELLPVSSGTCNYTTRHNIDATGSGIPNPSCGSYSGQDVWFKVVVPATGRLIGDMDVAGGPTDWAMAWYTGPDCNNLTELECDDDQSQNGSMPMICRTGMLCTVPGDCDQNATLTPGDTVWIRVWEYGGGSTGLFDICMYEPDPPGAPSNCSSPTNIASLPYTGNGLTTCCKQDDYTSSDGCANSYMDGEDYMFTYTPSVNQLINITVSGTGSYTGVFVTDKCPDAASVNCIAQNTNSSGNPFLCDVSVDAGTTYYIMVDTDPTPTCTDFNIQVSEAFAPTCNLNYTVSSIPYVGYPVAGTAISLPIDDRFSDYIPIGFPFCYDGIQYTQLLVSSNGYVIFDPVGCATNLPSDNAAPNTFTGWSISAAVPIPLTLQGMLLCFHGKI